ncbi:ABC transporter ATP-binding protein/permease [Paludibacterium purpuratum]|uniref:Putative ATP-binding cassette transporter n=1 Tax=Paludibacterium purpuratum TaxID=1144873 RepID=A0A4V3DV81_9NEIS|nr:ABC transporter ATP-binding protein/permease [Paludibacterium purpuratum]TDR79969.1 putative ATP-binding cassette transporter [Paludibacterium purpuratum]
MDWRQELLASGLWLLKTYLIVVLLCTGSVMLLIRSTQWGKQFWKLTGSYFSPRRHPRVLGILALVLLLTLLAVRVNVLFSNWYNGFYTAMQQLNESAFWRELLVFCVLAAVHVVRSLLDFYVGQSFNIHWREWLNEHLLNRWLERQAYYRSQYLDNPADNPDQRLQQDIASLVSGSLALSTGVVNALVSIVAYTFILWGLSGVLPLFGHEIPRGMVFAIFIYVLIATLFAFRIGRPLIRLNFLNEQLNADYRYALVRVREYAENMAFYCGEKVEGALLRSRFGAVIANAWRIVYRSLKFQGFNFVVSQTAVVFPFIIQAKRFFSKQITLGDMMQTAQAFSTLHDSLSFFRQAYDDFASYRAVLNRLSGFDQAIDQANALPVPQRREEGARVALENLTVRRPDGRPLVADAALEVRAGEPLLIRGRSGVGKTTLLRAMAGLWPYCEGRIVRPEQHVMFLSQKPYLPLGTLRDALYYPNPTTADDKAARQALIDVQLEYLVERLDEAADWSHILSLGEQQRLAFGRLLVGQPQAAFLDEATSAMDEELEQALYSMLCESLPQAVLVSVGHRSTLLRHHPRQLLLQGEGRWALAGA